MSTATEITRIQNARNTIRDKLIDLGLANSTAKIDVLATAVDGIVNNGAVSANIKEGEAYTIPAGYHNGSGTVTGVSGGGNYTLQAKEVTPTKSQQSVTPDAGNYGLSSVTVKAIPDAYQNVSGVTATAADVVANKIIVTATGESVAGTMPDNGTVEEVLDATTGNQSYTIPAGKHSGSGTVSIVLEEKSATPSTSTQNVTPTTGKVLSKVTVNPIPSNYGDVTTADGIASDVLEGKKVLSADSEGNAVIVTGTMPDNGTVTETLDATEGKQTYTIPAGKHSGSGTVSIILEEKSATPTSSEQVITPTSGKVLSKVTVAATPTEEKTATPTTSEQTVSPTTGKFLSKVTVNPIPSNYGDVANSDAEAGDIVAGKIAISKDSVTGSAIEIAGTMVDRGTITATIDGLTTTSYTIPAGKHSGSGTISLTNDIETALAAI